MIIIQNVVLCASLNCNIILKSVCLKLNNVVFKNNRLKCLVIRLRKPFTTCKLYRTGKLVLLGAKSYEDGRNAIRQVARKIQKLGYDVQLSNITVVNMVGSYDYTFNINLSKLFYVIGSNAVQYNQERFPALIFKTSICTINVYRTGKLVIYGGKKPEDLNIAFNELDPFVFESL